MKNEVVLLPCHFFQGQSVSVGVSVKKSVSVSVFMVFIRVYQVKVNRPISIALYNAHSDL